MERTKIPTGAHSLGSIFDVIPTIKEELGDRCPDDDVIRLIMTRTGNLIINRINRLHVQSATNERRMNS